MTTTTTTTTIASLPESHVDHGLAPDQLAWAVAQAEQRIDSADRVWTLTFMLPPRLGTAPCGLHGPLVGELPVLESEVHYAVRGERGGQSRLCDRPVVAQRQISVIAGPHEGQLVLFTAFGGPIAPREPWSPGLSPAEQTESDDFWAEHALSVSEPDA